MVKSWTCNESALAQIQLLVRAYQVRGHHIAKLDPLGIFDADLMGGSPPELDIASYGWTDADLDQEVTLGPGVLPLFAEEGHKKMKLREIIDACKRIYCQSLSLARRASLEAENITCAQAVRSAHNTSTCPIARNATGSDHGSSSQSRSSTRSRRSG